MIIDNALFEPKLKSIRIICTWDIFAAFLYILYLYQEGNQHNVKDKTTADNIFMVGCQWFCY